MMSRRQSALYWDLWRQVCARQGWGRADGERRHDAHTAALGHDKSSKEFTNADFDRIKMHFRLLIDPEDLEAAVFLEDPSQGTVKRLLHAIGKVPEALVLRIARERFGVANWRGLAPDQLHQLLMTLKRIQATQLDRFDRAREAAEAETSAPETEEVVCAGNCPF